MSGFFIALSRGILPQSCKPCNKFALPLMQACCLIGKLGTKKSLSCKRRYRQRKMLTACQSIL